MTQQQQQQKKNRIFLQKRATNNINSVVDSRTSNAHIVRHPASICLNNTYYNTIDVELI